MELLAIKKDISQICNISFLLKYEVFYKNYLRLTFTAGPF